MNPFHSPITAYVRSISALALLMAGAVGQTRWVVDLQNRPGTNFLDLPAAVQAAVPGDILFLREQTSQAFTAPAMITKGLSLVGETGLTGPAAILGALHFDSIGAANVTLTNLRLGIGAFNGGLSIANCTGIVTVDNVACWGDSLVEIQNCSLAYLRSVSATTSIQGHTFDNSTAFVQDCTWEAFNWLAPTPAAMTLTDAEVVLIRNQVRGSMSPTNPTVGIDMLRSRLTLDTSTEVLGSPSDISGDLRSNVVADPDVNMGGGVTVIGGATHLTQAVASMAAPTLQMGTTATFELFSSPGDLSIVLLGDPTVTPVPLPIVGIQGNLWLNPGANIVSLGFVILDGQGYGAFALPIPVSPSLLDGVPFTFQAAMLSTTGGSANTMTNPMASVLRN